MFSLFAKLTSGLLTKRGLVSVRRSDAIFVLLMLLCALSLSLLVIDAYALSLSRADGVAPVPSETGTALKEQDIDAVLEILSEREEKLQALLGGKPSQTATSTPQ